MTDSSNAATVGDLFRSLGAIINKGAYFLLGLMYQIFFNVSSAQLFESETIKNFYGRVQLIIGVFMIFKLAVSILQGIMNPDKFTNPKEGFGNVITRIIISLALLTVLVPINVPNVESANSYEKYLNNNGLLFGTLYSLQDRILSNNTLGRLILGTTDDATSVTDEEAQDGMTEADKQNAKLEKSANVFASTILKGFLRINLLPEELRASDDESDPKNWYCGSNLSDEGKAAVNAYNKLDIEPSTLLSDDVVTVDCEINDNWLSGVANAASNIPFIGGLFENFGGKSRYVFAFEWVWSFIVGAIFLVILVSFTVDIAIRSIKLAILRLIAPIPVISYIEPSSSSSGGMFSSWVKTLTSTYLDLFLRLAIVYFVIFLIQDMIVNGIVINEAGGMVGIISCIFIWIGLFVFAKEAPKFIKKALGIKEDAGGKLFGGLSSIGKIGAATLGTIGATRAALRASKIENDALHPGQNIRNLGRRLASGIAGATGGAYTGAKAFYADKSSVSSVLDAQRKKNAMRTAHSTLPGRFVDNMSSIFNGRSLADYDQGMLDAGKKAADSIKNFKSTAVDRAMKAGDYGTVSAAKDRFGRLNGIHFNYRQLEAALGTKDSTGNFNYTDASGNTHSLNAAWFDSGVMADIEDTQTSRYLAAQFNGTGFNDGQIDTAWSYAKHDMSDANISYTAGDRYLGESNYKDIGIAIGDANKQAASMSNDMKYVMRRANSHVNKK